MYIVLINLQLSTLNSSLYGKGRQEFYNNLTLCHHSKKLPRNQPSTYFFTHSYFFPFSFIAFFIISSSSSTLYGLAMISDIPSRAICFSSNKSKPFPRCIPKLQLGIFPKNSGKPEKIRPQQSKKSWTRPSIKALLCPTAMKRILCTTPSGWRCPKKSL